MMTLAAWMKRRKMTDEAFALEVGASPSLVSKWRRRLVEPGLRHGETIRVLTRGRVSVRDLLRLGSKPLPVVKPIPVRR